MPKSNVTIDTSRISEFMDRKLKEFSEILSATERLTTILPLRRVRIELDSEGKGSVIDLETGHSIWCSKIEFTHEVRKSPVLILHVNPLHVEYLLDNVEATIVKEKVAEASK